MKTKDIFDSMAKKYDIPERVEIAGIITNEIKNCFKDTKDKILLDYGCGTGLIGLSFVDDFEKVFLADISKEMLACVDKKAQENEIENIKTIYLDDDKTIDSVGKVDYIIMVQTLLHIKDSKEILNKLYQLLNNDGQFIIVDFDKNDLVDATLVHPGFDQIELTKRLSDIGYKDINSQTFYERDNFFMKQKASVFIMNARK